MFKKKMHKIKILFKSGNTITFKAEEFDGEMNGEIVAKLNWTNTKPRLMFISLPEIEAIFVDN